MAGKFILEISRPWISFSLTNVGPGNVKVRVQTKVGGLDKEAEIIVRQTVNYDFHIPLVTRVYLISDSNTEVRIYAMEGKD